MSDLISRKILLEEIENLYDLNYGEILIDPREFYDMVDCQKIIDMDKDLQDTYNKGYKQGLVELVNKMEKELTNASWYSKGEILAYITKHYGK
jgi:hypothetical protein